MENIILIPIMIFVFAFGFFVADQALAIRSAMPAMALAPPFMSM